MPTTSRFPARIALVFATSMLFACGGGGDSPAGPKPPTSTLAINATGKVTLTPGGSATSTVSVTRGGGFAGAVSLSVSGAPSTVIASISPTTLAAGVTSATITWVAVSNATAGTYPITVQATGSAVAAASSSLSLIVTSAPAAAMAVVGGDEQTISSGTAFPVAPRVVVRSAGGAPVAGVTVTFARDSGSSQLLDSVRVTNADGEAQLGSWIAGPGRNVISATAGTLAPVRFHATGTGSLTVGDKTIPAGGGTVVITRLGDPLNGTQITVPSEAFTGATRVVLQYGTPTPIPGRAGTTPLLPLITISADKDGVAGAPITLKIPARIPKGVWPIAVIRNPTTGAFVTVPAIAIDSTAVLITLSYFDAAEIGPPTTEASRIAAVLRLGGSGSIGTSLRSSADGEAPYALQMLIGAVPFAALNETLDTGYQPATDNFEFDQLLSRVNPWERYANGLSIMAAWYFDKFKAARGALSGRFQKAKGVELSNVQGIRLAAEIDMLANSAALARYAGSLVLGAGEAKIPVDSLKLLLLKSALYQTGRPQLLVGNTSGNVAQTGLLVYRAAGNILNVTLGTSISGNTPATVTYSNGAFNGLTYNVKDFDTDAPRPVSISSYMLSGQGGFGAAQLNGWWQQVFAENVGAGKYPTWYLATKDTPRITGDTIWIAEDSVRFWVECTCTDGFSPGPGVTPTAKIASANIYLKQGETWQSLEKAVRGNGLKVEKDRDGVVIGLAIGERYASGGGSFFDWGQAVIKVRELTITPDSSTQEADTLFTLTANSTRAVPSGATWEWELGDGRTVTSNTKSTEIKYPISTSGQDSTYIVKVRVKKDGKVWASGKTTVTIKTSTVAAWRITSLVDQDDFFDVDQNEGGGTDAEKLKQVIANPARGLIAVTGTAIKELAFYSKQSGVWSSAQCCPPPITGADGKIVLGVTPPTTNDFGPFFSAWLTHSWSQSTNDLSTGTMTGQFTVGRYNFPIYQGGLQAGPEYGVRITATRNGLTMTGVMTFTSPFASKDGTLHEGDLDDFRFPFTAVRLK